jgi:hypothetical protein
LPTVMSRNAAFRARYFDAFSGLCTFHWPMYAFKGAQREGLTLP